MRYTRPATLIVCLLSTTACAMFQAKETPPPPQPQQLSVPVGENWRVIEEAPVLTNERNERPPYHTEQSLQPEGVQRPGAPTEKGRKIETTR